MTSHENQRGSTVGTIMTTVICYYNPRINFLHALIGQNASRARGTKSDDGYQTIYPVRFDIRQPIL